MNDVKIIKKVYYIFKIIVTPITTMGHDNRKRKAESESRNERKEKKRKRRAERAERKKEKIRRKEEKKKRKEEKIARKKRKNEKKRAERTKSRDELMEYVMPQTWTFSDENIPSTSTANVVDVKLYSLADDLPYEVTEKILEYALFGSLYCKWHHSRISTDESRDMKIGYLKSLLNGFKNISLVSKGVHDIAVKYREEYYKIAYCKIWSRPIGFKSKDGYYNGVRHALVKEPALYDYFEVKVKHSIDMLYMNGCPGGGFDNVEKYIWKPAHCNECKRKFDKWKSDPYDKDLAHNIKYVYHCSLDHLEKIRHMSYSRRLNSYYNQVYGYLKSTSELAIAHCKTKEEKEYVLDQLKLFKSHQKKLTPDPPIGQSADKRYPGKRKHVWEIDFRPQDKKILADSPGGIWDY